MKVEIRPVISKDGIRFVIKKPGFFGGKYWCIWKSWKSDNDMMFDPVYFTSAKKAIECVRTNFGDQCKIIPVWL